MRTHRSTVLVGALVAGLALTQQACSITGGPGNNPVAFTAPAPEGSAQPPVPSADPTFGTAKTGTRKTGTTKPRPAKTDRIADPILAGRRQVVIKPIPSFESIVAVDDRGRLGLTDGEAAHSLFVLTPVGAHYLIKTARADASGEPSCLGLKSDGTVVAAACDAGRVGQLFTIARQQTKARTYAISTQGAFLQVSAKRGLIAEELGDAPPATTYAFVDNGPSTLPAD